MIGALNYKILFFNGKQMLVYKIKKKVVKNNFKLFSNFKYKFRELKKLFYIYFSFLFGKIIYLNIKS